MQPLPLSRRNLRNLVLMTLSVAWPPNTCVVVRNAVDVRREEPWRNWLERSRNRAAAVQALMDRALNWLCRSQDEVGSGGIGDLAFQGWTPGYPEVTGYIIPTLWDYAHELDREELARRAVRMADWELSIQLPSGGFESLYAGEGRPPVVFNTGQVLRGLIRSHKETDEEKYLDAAVRAGDWIVANQEDDGSWTKANYLGMKRTYDVFAAAALAQLSSTTSDQRYAAAAKANCEFALQNQQANGWFELCDNTPFLNHAPSTHTLCYTVAGLMECGELLSVSSFVDGATKAAESLRNAIEPSGRLRGRFDSQWKPFVSYVVVTGSAQLGVILMELHSRESDERYLKSALKLLDFLGYLHYLNAVGQNRTGALPGSYPIWGRYVPLKYPSWATKFFLDFLLLVRQAQVLEAGSKRSAAEPARGVTDGP
jgi:hypothetical protein